MDFGSCVTILILLFLASAANTLWGILWLRPSNQALRAQLDEHRARLDESMKEKKKLMVELEETRKDLLATREELQKTRESQGDLQRSLDACTASHDKQ